MKAWLARVLGRSEQKVATAVEEIADLHCSFCGLHRREVQKLVAGPAVYICDRCIALCVGILDEEAPSGTYYAELMIATLNEWSVRAPHAKVTPRLRAIIELANGVPTILRDVVAVAWRFEDPATALAAIAAIAPEQRNAADALNIAALLSEAGRYGEALAALDKVDTSGLSAADMVLYKLHRAYAELERGDCTRVQLAVHRKTAYDLAADLAALPEGAFMSALQGERLAVLALALLGLGEVDEAEAAARERIALQHDNPSAIELLARILDVRGNRTDASTERDKALSHANPDGALARKLRTAATRTGPFR